MRAYLHILLHGPSADFIPISEWLHPFSSSRPVNRVVLLGLQGFSLSWDGAEGAINPAAGVSYQRAIDYGVDEYLTKDLQEEIKTLRVHLTLLCQGWRPTMNPWVIFSEAFPPPCWVCAYEQDVALQIGCSWHHVPCCHIIYSQIESRSVWHCNYFKANTLSCHMKCKGDFFFYGTTWKIHFTTEPYNSMKFQLWLSQQCCKDTLVTIPPHSAAFKRCLNNAIKRPP